MEDNGFGEHVSRPRTRRRTAREAQDRAAVSTRTRGRTAASSLAPSQLAPPRPPRRNNNPRGATAAAALAAGAAVASTSESPRTAPPSTTATPSPIAAPTPSRPPPASILSGGGLNFVPPSTPAAGLGTPAATPVVATLAASGDGGREDSSGKEDEGLRTPETQPGGDCAICLGPLEGNDHEEQQPQGIYTVQGCGHDFHRACLVESRRAGNRGCPYCRGELERGLTPAPTAAERSAAAEREALSAARRAALNSAIFAMVDVHEALTAVGSVVATGRAATTAAAMSSANAAARSTQAAVSGVLDVVRLDEPSAAMYTAASTRLHASRMQLHRIMERFRAMLLVREAEVILGEA